VLDEHVELLERALVEEQLDALARGELAAGMLLDDALFAAAQQRLGAALFQFAKNILHRPSLSWQVPGTSYHCRRGKRQTPLRRHASS
jgi:hypothetical protein